MAQRQKIDRASAAQFTLVRMNSLLVFGCFMRFVENKTNTEHHQASPSKPQMCFVEISRDPMSTKGWFLAEKHWRSRNTFECAALTKTCDFPPTLAAQL